MNLGLLLSIQKDAPTPDEQYENVSEDEAYAGYVDNASLSERRQTFSMVFVLSIFQSFQLLPLREVFTIYSDCSKVSCRVGLAVTLPLNDRSH